MLSNEGFDVFLDPNLIETVDQIFDFVVILDAMVVKRRHSYASLSSLFSPLNKRLVTDIYEHGFVTVMCDDYAYFPDEGIETTTPGQMRE